MAVRGVRNWFVVWLRYKKDTIVRVRGVQQMVFDKKQVARLLHKHSLLVLLGIAQHYDDRFHHPLLTVKLGFVDRT